MTPEEKEALKDRLDKANSLGNRVVWLKSVLSKLTEAASTYHYVCIPLPIMKGNIGNNLYLSSVNDYKTKEVLYQCGPSLSDEDKNFFAYVYDNLKDEIQKRIDELEKEYTEL